MCELVFREQLQRCVYGIHREVLGIPIYNILKRTCNIVLAHPKYIKPIQGKKIDKRDAK